MVREAHIKVGGEVRYRRVGDKPLARSARIVELFPEKREALLDDGVLAGYYALYPASRSEASPA